MSPLFNSVQVTLCKPIKADPILKDEISNGSHRVHREKFRGFGMKTTAAQVIAVSELLEKDLTTVLRLKSESGQLLVPLLITSLALAVFLLL